MSLADLNEQLARVRADLDESRRWQERYRRLEEEHDRALGEWRALARQMKREGQDVEQLEGLSLTRLFHTVLGSREQQLEKERQEFLAAKLRHDAARSRLAQLEADLAEARRHLDAGRTAEGEYQRLLARKEAELRQGYHPAAAEILDLAEQAGAAAHRERELSEALAAAEAAEAALQEVVGSLRKARGWGTWDLLGGGGVSDWMKYSHVDDAKRAAMTAQHALSRLGRELADVSIRLQGLDLEVSGLSRFADFFFDNLLTDWTVRQRISTALEGAESILRQVQGVIPRLRSDHAAETKRRQDLEQRRRTLLEQVV